MKYLEKVPFDANLTVVTGTDEHDAQSETMSYLDACVKLNDWNRGRYHPDFWIDVYYFKYGQMQEVMICWDDVGQMVESIYFLSIHS